MAINPLAFVASPSGSINGQRIRNSSIRTQDFLRASAPIGDTPRVIKSQVNQTINNITKRTPQRIQQAGNNIAINAVTSTVSGAIDGFKQDGISGILTGGVSEGFSGAIDGVTGSIGQIGGNVLGDVDLGLGGITNNAFGGALTPLTNSISGGLKNLTGMATNVLTNGIDSISGSVAGLFGGDENAEPIGGLLDENGALTGDGVLVAVDINVANCKSAQLQQDVRDRADVIAVQVNAGKYSDSNVAEDQAFFEEASANCQFVPDDLTSFIRSEPNPKNFATGLLPFQPKYKFMFIVEFQFNPEYRNLIDNPDEFNFVVKNSTRPNVSFEYEEINMYNFWTRVPKRTQYESMTTRFYDDDKNNANSFYTQYMRAMSPIATVNSAKNNISPNFYQETSIAGKSDTSRNGGDYDFRHGGGSLGTPLGNAFSILSKISIYQLYEWGKLANVFHMTNPKVTNLTLDDLDMADSGNGSEVEVQFSYDGLFVEEARLMDNPTLQKLTGSAFSSKQIDPVYEADFNDAKGHGPAGPPDSPSAAAPVYIGENLQAFSGGTAKEMRDNEVRQALERAGQ